MAENKKELSDEERFQLDVPPEQEDTRAEDEYMNEGNLYHSLKEITDSFEKNEVLQRSSIVSVLKMLIESNCAHYWVQHLNDISKYSCVKCRTPQNVDAKTMTIDNHNSRPR